MLFLIIFQLFSFKCDFFVQQFHVKKLFKIKINKLFTTMRGYRRLKGSAHLNVFYVLIFVYLKIILSNIYYILKNYIIFCFIFLLIFIC